MSTLEINIKKEVKSLVTFIKDIEDKNLPLLVFKETIKENNQDLDNKMNIFKKEIFNQKNQERIKFYLESLEKEIKSKGLKETIKENKLENYIEILEDGNEYSNINVKINNIKFNVNNRGNFKVDKDYILKNVQQSLEDFFENKNNSEITKEEKQFIYTLLRSKNIDTPKSEALSHKKDFFELLSKKSDRLYELFKLFMEEVCDTSLKLQETLENIEKPSKELLDFKKEYGNPHGGVVFNKKTTTSIFNNKGEIIDRGEHLNKHKEQKDKIIELIQSKDSIVSQVEIHAKNSGGNLAIDLDKVINVLSQLNKMNINVNQKINFKVVPLGQHKANGIFFQGFDIVAVDGKKPSSILHEIIHLIDMNTIIKNKDLINEREEIIRFGRNKMNYEKIVDLYKSNPKKLSKKLNYYDNEYEIIARMGEAAGLLMLEMDNDFIPTKEGDIPLIKSKEEYLKNKGIYGNFDTWTKEEKMRVIEFYKSYFTSSKDIELTEAISQKTKIGKTKKSKAKLDLEDGNIEVTETTIEYLKMINKSLPNLISSLIENKKNYKKVEINGEYMDLTYGKYINELVNQILNGEKRTLTELEFKELVSLGEVNANSTIAKVLSYTTPEEIKSMLKENSEKKIVDEIFLIQFIIDHFDKVNDNLYLKVKKEPRRTGSIVSHTQSQSLSEILINVKTRSKILYTIFEYVAENIPNKYEELIEYLKENKTIIFDKGLYQSWTGGRQDWKRVSSYEVEGEINYFEKIKDFFKEDVLPIEVEIKEEIVVEQEVEKGNYVQQTFDFENIEEKVTKKEEQNKYQFIIPSNIEELREFYKNEFINGEYLNTEIEQRIISLIDNENTKEELEKELESILIKINKDLNIEEIEQEINQGNTIVFDIESSYFTIEETNDLVNNGYDEQFNKAFNNKNINELKDFLKKDFKKKLEIKTRNIY